jgi:hypothetical protein
LCTHGHTWDLRLLLLTKHRLERDRRVVVPGVCVVVVALLLCTFRGQ